MRRHSFCHPDVMADDMTSSVLQGAIMAVGASQPVVVATADGMFGVKKQMQVSDTCQNENVFLIYK